MSGGASAPGPAILSAAASEPRSEPTDANAGAPAGRFTAALQNARGSDATGAAPARTDAAAAAPSTQDTAASGHHGAASAPAATPARAASPPGAAVPAGGVAAIAPKPMAAPAAAAAPGAADPTTALLPELLAGVAAPLDAAASSDSAPAGGSTTGKGSAKDSRASADAAAPAASGGLLAMLFAAGPPATPAKTAVGAADRAKTAADGAGAAGTGGASGASAPAAASTLGFAPAGTLPLPVLSGLPVTHDGGATAGPAGGDPPSAAASSATSGAALLGDLMRSFGPAAATAAAPAITVPVGDGRWAQAVAAQVHWLASSGVSSATLRLSPEHLGPLEVRIDLQSSQVNVSFSATHPDTRVALEQALPRLRELFASGGLALGQASVQQESRPGSHSAAPARSDRSPDAAPAALAGVARALGLVDEYV